MSEQTEERYRVTFETTVGEVLFVVPGAAAIFERHGCEPTIECTDVLEWPVTANARDADIAGVPEAVDRFSRIAVP